MEEEDDDKRACNSCTAHNQDACQSCSARQVRRPHTRWSFQPYGIFFPIWTVIRAVGSIISCILTGAVALAGAMLGGISGAIAGRSARCGCLRGASLGAVAGVVLSVEVLQALKAYWHSECSGANSIPSFGDFIDDLMTGRFVQDFVVPSVSAAQRWQLAVPEVNYEELYEMFVPGDVKVEGATEGMLRSLAKHIVTQMNDRDASGDAFSCAICLQELEHGDLARTLPICKHTFHLKCVDQWLAKHFMCPVCRHCIQCQK